MRYLIGRYHEIALKGRNQWRFVDQVKQNLRDIFGDYRLGNMRSVGPRLMVQLPDELSDETAAERAALIFGLQNFSLSHSTPRDIESIAREAIKRATGSKARTFAVRTKREDKRFAMNSVEVDRAVGGEVQDALGFEVDLSDPELTISIEIMSDAAYVSAGKMPGAGGLPVGVTGRGMALLSGGIDSPVAAHRMMRRGLRLDFVHFHAHPLVTAASKEKARELAAHLTRWQARSTLMLVPFGNLQREIVANTLRPLRVVLYRRFMLRIASALARAFAGDRVGHGRKPGPGRVADAGEHGGDREGGGVSGHAAAGGDGQERDHRAGAPAAHVRNVDFARRGLLHAVRAGASGDARANRGSRGGGIALRYCADDRRRGARHRSRALRVPAAGRASSYGQSARIAVLIASVIIVIGTPTRK